MLAVDKWLTLAKKFGTECEEVDDKENSEVQASLYLFGQFNWIKYFPPTEMIEVRFLS